MTPRMAPEEARKIVAKSRGKQPESLVLDQARQYLRMRGWVVIRIQQGIGCHRGISDLICIKDGTVVFAEVKTLKGKLSEHQVKFQADVEAHGGRYVVIRSLEDAMELDRGMKE